MHVRFPIRLKLALAICLPLLAVYATVLVIEYQVGKEQAIQQTRDLLAESAAKHAFKLDGELSTIGQIAYSTAVNLGNSPPQDRAQLDQLLQSHLDDRPQGETNLEPFGTCIALEPGVLGKDSPACAPYLCRSPDGRGVRHVDIAREVPNYTRMDWYLLPKLLKRPAWTDPYFDEGAGNVLMCTYSVPILRQGDNRFLGVVTIDISLKRVRKELEAIRLGSAYCMLTSRAGTFVSHPMDGLVMAESLFSLAEGYGVPELAELGKRMTAEHLTAGVARVPDYENRGAAKWYVYAPVESVGWALTAVIPEEEVMREVYRRLYRELGLLLGGLALIIFCVLLVAAWITRPLELLAGAARLVAGGDLSAQASGIQSRDEIGQFATTFNQMVRDLKDNVEAIVRETAARQAMENELQLARQIQTSLLPAEHPPFPDRHEFSLHAENEPARYMAGDFFDYWLLEEDVVALVIADVVGKGVPAAMFMAVSRTAIRNYSAAGRSPAETLAMANRALAGENRQQMFVTVFYGHYHTRTGQLVFANGGHNPPYLVRAGGQIEDLGSSTGPIVGIFEDAEFEDGSTRLEPGDLLVLYTDGVTEAQDEAGKLLGDEGFREILQQVQAQPVEEMCQNIIGEVNRYRNNEAQDDVTVLALRRNG